MDEAVACSFRSYEEMDFVYQELHEKGLDGELYVAVKRKKGQLLVFVGARHSNNPRDPQSVLIEKEWEKFITHRNKDKIAFCEGGVPPESNSKAAAIRIHSEPGLLTWLAAKDDVAIASPEPDKTKEVEYLQERGYSTAQIMTYYFGRQMYHWARQDKLNFPDWEEYAKRHIRSYGELNPFKDERLTLWAVLDMYQETTKVKFDKNDEALLYSISNPSTNPVSAASSVFRNVSIFSAIANAWHEGKDVFSLYGSGHAIILERALRAL